MKLIFLRLTEIRYAGVSIGDDISIDISAGGKRLSLNKRLSAGTKTSLRTLIGDFTAYDDPFRIPITVTITDRDPVYDDIGTTTGRYPWH